MLSEMFSYGPGGVNRIPVGRSRGAGLSRGCFRRRRSRTLTLHMIRFTRGASRCWQAT